jgi:NitT/TauT family transport system substrate-binding protein
MMVANREFVQKNPVATKRVLRAILKAADLCAQDPEGAARLVVQKGFTKNYAYALEALKEVSYSAWRTFDPDASMRFHALRLHDVGMIKSSPQKIIAQGTNWRFLNELRSELKA